MSTRINFHGHSTFLIESGSHSILLDPFYTGNPVASCTADEVQPTAIAISHGHLDHVGDTVAIAERTGALTIANYEIVTWLQKQGVKKAHPQHVGGGFTHPFGHLKLTLAHHGSQLPDGTDGGSPCGILLTLDDCTIYFAGDTALFSDMRLIGEAGLDVAILPIGDNFTMGPDDALRAIEFLQPKRVIPCHYNTWPLIEQDCTAWAERVRTTTSANPVILDPGDYAEI